MGLEALEMPAVGRHLLKKSIGRGVVLNSVYVQISPAYSGTIRGQDWIAGDSGRGVGRERLPKEDVTARRRREKHGNKIKSMSNVTITHPPNLIPP